MEVSVVIERHASGSLQVEILPFSTAKSWTKIYATKMLCLGELFALGWLLAPEFLDAQASELDIRDRPLIFRTDIDIDIAKAVGFVALEDSQE